MSKKKHHKGGLFGKVKKFAKSKTGKALGRVAVSAGKAAIKGQNPIQAGAKQGVKELAGSGRRRRR